VSQYPPGQQPQYPQQQGYPPQGQYPQQYPQPYSPYQAPQVHPMAYAAAQMQGMGWQFSRAGIMLIITGGLMALCGLGCGAMAFMPLEEALANAQMDPEVAALMTPRMMKLALFVIAGGSIVYAALAIILGVMVRRQSKGAAIAGIVITSLILAYLGFNMLEGLVQMNRLGPKGFIGACIMLVPLVIFVWQLVWLIGAVKSAAPLKAMQGQMQMQYWQMMQMQQQQYQQMMAQQQKGQGTGDLGQGKTDGGQTPPPV
jgi:hypothetical protein